MKYTTLAQTIFQAILELQKDFQAPRDFELDLFVSGLPKPSSPSFCIFRRKVEALEAGPFCYFRRVFAAGEISVRVRVGEEDFGRNAALLRERI